MFARMRSAAIALIATTPAAAEVISSTPTGFQVSRTITVTASPAEAYAALVRVGDWWNGEHTYSGKAANLSIDARPGGCFCETLPNGGGVEHGRILYADPGKVLRFSGSLGPLQGDAIAGTMTWAISAEGGATKIKQTYVAGGYTGTGFQKLAPLVDQVLSEQVDRLKTHLDAGGGARRRP
ncbi:ATPase [Sphingomonas sp. DBB INV C78]|uniref:ATPase n=1 Tax=Sphingomonas sp. DBB INV C78 TaxID=3349434 RepID=UPI0036D4175B